MIDKEEAIERLRCVESDLETAKAGDAQDWDKHSWQSLLDYVESVREFLDDL